MKNYIVHGTHVNVKKYEGGRCRNRMDQERIYLSHVLASEENVVILLNNLYWKIHKNNLIELRLYGNVIVILFDVCMTLFLNKKRILVCTYVCRYRQFPAASSSIIDSKTKNTE